MPHDACWNPNDVPYSYNKAIMHLYFQDFLHLSSKLPLQLGHKTERHNTAMTTEMTP